MNDELIHNVEEDKQTWESYKERMKERMSISEKLWRETKFIRPKENLDAYGEWVNENNYFLSDLDPLNEGLECHRYFTVSFQDKSSKDQETKRFVVRFEPKSTTVKDVKLSSDLFEEDYYLPDEQNDRRPE